MDQHKIDNYLKENPGKGFPFFKTLKDPDLRVIKAKVLQAIEKKLGIRNFDFSKGDLSKSTLSANPESNIFSLTELISSLNIVVRDFVYVNWYRFDRIDKIKLTDLCENFEYIWYPGSDDIEVFDNSLEWMISISHGGQVSLVF